MEERWAKLLGYVGLPLIVATFFATAAAHFGYTPDDAFIYFRFARNLAQGGGIAFNAGEPTYGVTGPLWLFLVSAGAATGADIPMAAKAVDLFIAAGSIIVFYLAVGALVRDGIASLLSTLAFSVNVWFLRWAGSGMETSLAVCLILGAVFFVLRNDYLLATVATAMLTLVRPEGALFLAFVLADLILNSHDRRRGATLALKYAAVFAGLLLPWLLYAYRTFGTVVPNTALAKSHDGLGVASLAAGISNIAQIVGASEGVALGALIVAGAYLWRRLREASPDQRFYWGRATLLLAGWPVALVLLYLGRNVTVVSRYMLLATPLLLILTFAIVFEAVAYSRFTKFGYAGIFLLAGLVLLQNQVVYRAVVRPGIEAFEEGMDASLISIGRWLHDHTRPDETVLCWDIGAIGYYSDRRICDAAGLVTPGMIKDVAAGRDLREIVEGRLYEPYCTVSFVVHRDEAPDALAADGHLVPLFSRPFFRIGLLKMRQDYYTVYHVEGGTDRRKETP